MSKALFDYAEQGHGRITTAEPYLRDLQKCLAQGDACPAKTMDLSADQWQKMLGEAAQRLTFCDPFTEIEKTFGRKEHDGTQLFSGLDDAEGVPEKSLMVYDAVLATNEKDRDGDIVHPEGMELEQKMPLLWQHVWSSPIGVMVKNLESSTSRNVNRYAIADTPLGKDAATLVEMGALRKSHGFLPVPGHFEPLDAKKDGDAPGGYRIKRLRVYESSLVSVPSGAKAVVLQHYAKEFDAICQAVSEKRLQTDVVKQWASSHYENRTKVFGGADLNTKSVTQDFGATLAVGEPLRQAIDLNINLSGEKQAEPSETLADLGVKALDEKSLFSAIEPETPGSFEAIQDSLRSQARKNHETDDSYVTIVGTFSGSVIYCNVKFGRFDDDDKRTCYRQSWSMQSGKPKLSGEPKEVEITPSVVDKSLSSDAEYGRWAAKQKEKAATVAAPSSEDPILSLFQK